MGIFVWTLDDGYGDGKGSNGKGTPIIVPNAITSYRAPIQDDINNGVVDPLSHIGVTVDGVKYLMGHGAMATDPKLEWMGGTNKHKDKMFPVWLKGMFALMADKDSQVVVDPLVMGLPAKTEQDTSRHDLLKNIALGDHQVTIELANGEVSEKHIRIEDVVIKEQSFGSFCSVVLDRNGSVADPVKANQFVVVVDIGAGTLCITAYNQLKRVPDILVETRHGMFTAYKWVGQYIEQTLKAPVPTGKLPLVIQSKNIQGVDLTPVIDKCYADLANQIMRVVESTLADWWAYVDLICFTGGGAELLKTHLHQYYNDRDKHIYLNRYSNAIGLRNYGVRQARKKHEQPERLPNGGIKIRSVVK